MTSRDESNKTANLVWSPEARTRQANPRHVTSPGADLGNGIRIAGERVRLHNRNTPVELFAQPWWVNLLVLVPIAAYLSWRTSLQLPLNLLGALALWSIAFGFLEATVVVYLRAIIGVLAGYDATFSGIARLSANLGQQPFVTLSRDLSVVEVWREAATMIMLLGVALLSSRRWRDRSACFLWAFAVWDISYYLALRIMIGWPPSMTTPDVLFLIPRPWMAQIWFPLLVSILTIVAVMMSRSRIGQLKTFGETPPDRQEITGRSG